MEVLGKKRKTILYDTFVWRRKNKFDFALCGPLVKDDCFKTISQLRNDAMITQQRPFASFDFAVDCSWKSRRDEVAIISIWHWSDFQALQCYDVESWFMCGEKTLFVVGKENHELTFMDLRFGEMIHYLVARSMYLQDTIAMISTLGGGWASVGQRHKAHHYAMKQKSAARILGDETLELLSNVYIAYGMLYKGEREEAERIIDEQTALAKKRGEKRQLAIVHAAHLQLEKERNDRMQQEKNV